MDVLQEILKWSGDKPIWQQDALRRLLVKGALDDNDYSELLTLCKSRHGLVNSITSEPITDAHISGKSSASESINLTSLTHHDGVNALAQNQTVKFGPGLTVVYGQNAAGKSGYTRVLKRACRARGSEDVLGNVLSETVPTPPSVTLAYQAGSDQKKWQWSNDKNVNPELGNVSVFDRHCATVYLDEKTDVAFRPFGLDLFDKLSAASEKLKALLDKERSLLSAKEYQTSIPQGTKAIKLVENITSLTNFDELKLYGSLSEAEKKHHEDLRKRLQDLKSPDIEKTKKSLTLFADRLKHYRLKLQKVRELLTQDKIDSIYQTRQQIQVKELALASLTIKIQKYDTLNAVNTDEWAKMWTATSEFSKSILPGKSFPIIEHNAPCPLCQQELDTAAKERLAAFGELMESDTKKELNVLKARLQSETTTIQAIKDEKLAASDALLEIQIEEPELFEKLKTEIQVAEQFAADVEYSNTKLNVPVNIFESIVKVEALETAVLERLKSLAKGSTKEELATIESEIKELDSREVLQKELTEISNEIERKKRLAAYNLCFDDVSTTAITRKSTELTKQTVTDQLANSFKSELKKIGFGYPEIELQPSGGSRGTLYHKLAIKQASHVRLQNVVSEGEARALSLAAFFSELSTSTNTSAILFDDPVSSLDHVWRDRVAARLVEEAKIRQTVVFTHDVVFVVTLKRMAEERKVDCLDQYIHKEYSGAGVCSSDLPWVAMKIKARIGTLKNLWQEAEKVERTVSKDEYDKKAIAVYGLLREAWERALEEVLINGIVERYRPSIQSQQIKILADIIDEDCNIFYEAMTKCSRWLPGHDNAPAENSPVPDSKELQTDINTLESWVNRITARRRK
jgi:energy-coupling factor transporter ATP-binding protein EcfA2